ncbi:MAG: hypothetical protein CMN30_18905 [Sandaracinus sp.]|nr:hypothetical protein [Sandaracinus sp.]
MTVDLDELARRAREVEPAWDDLREQRVLDGIRRGAAEPTPARPRVGLWVAAGAFLVLAGGGVLAAALLGGAPSPGRAPIASSEGPGAAPERARESRLGLADGSQVLLEAAAEVQVLEQGPTEVRLHQRAGTATYEVARRPERAFVVEAGEVRVTVRGTVFTVVVDAAGVTVRVREGRVEVAVAERLSLLGAGDALTVALSSSDAESLGPESPRLESPRPESRRPESPPERPAREPRPAAGPARPPVEATSSTEPPGAPPEAAEGEPSTPEGWLDLADAARREGRLPDAAAALEALLTRFPRDARAPSAAFTLGRVQARRGLAAEAARSYGRAAELAAGGPLTEDALAREATAWADAGRGEAARQAARRYLAAYPTGLHAARMQRILAGTGE